MKLLSSRACSAWAAALGVMLIVNWACSVMLRPAYAGWDFVFALSIVYGIWGICAFAAAFRLSRSRGMLITPILLFVFLFVVASVFVTSMQPGRSFRPPSAVWIAHLLAIIVYLGLAITFGRRVLEAVRQHL
jgi:hypothetical protein